MFIGSFEKKGYLSSSTRHYIISYILLTGLLILCQGANAQVQPLVQTSNYKGPLNVAMNANLNISDNLLLVNLKYIIYNNGPETQRVFSFQNTENVSNYLLDNQLLDMKPLNELKMEENEKKVLEMKYSIPIQYDNRTYFRPSLLVQFKRVKITVYNITIYKNKGLVFCINYQCITNSSTGTHKIIVNGDRIFDVAVIEYHDSNKLLNIDSSPTKSTPANDKLFLVVNQSNKRSKQTSNLFNNPDENNKMDWVIQNKIYIFSVVLVVLFGLILIYFYFLIKRNNNRQPE